jgi:hypothetical protein
MVLDLLLILPCPQTLFVAPTRLPLYGMQPHFGDQFLPTRDVTALRRIQEESCWAGDQDEQKKKKKEGLFGCPPRPNGFTGECKNARLTRIAMRRALSLNN